MSDDDLDWDDMRYFLAAARTGTLAGAARAMGVEHTTIGRRLSALERTLAAPLVLRGPEGLELTALGAKLVPLVEDVERAVQAVCDLAAARKTRVRLAVPTGFTQMFAGGLARLRREHPDISLEVMSGSRPVDLARGEADLALRSGPISDPDLVVRKLAESGWSLYASKTYLERRPAPADPERLAGHEIIGYDTSLSAVPAARWVEERAGEATIVLRSREMTDMLAAALGGVGLALLPCSIADDEERLVRLTPRVLATRTISLVYRREARLSDAVRAVMEFVVEIIGENAVKISGTQSS